MSGLDQTSEAIGSLTARVGQVEADMKAIKAGQDEILAILNKAKGSWRTLLVIGSLLAAIGSAASFITEHIKVMLK
jgi:hypothetical protein